MSRRSYFSWCLLEYEIGKIDGIYSQVQDRSTTLSFVAITRNGGKVGSNRGTNSPYVTNCTR